MLLCFGCFFIARLLCMSLITAVWGRRWKWPEVQAALLLSFWHLLSDPIGRSHSPVSGSGCLWSGKGGIMRHSWRRRQQCLHPAQHYVSVAELSWLSSESAVSLCPTGSTKVEHWRSPHCRSLIPLFISTSTIFFGVWKLLVAVILCYINDSGTERGHSVTCCRVSSQ